MRPYHMLYSLSTDQLANFLDDADHRKVRVLGVHSNGPSGWIVITADGVGDCWVGLGRAPRPEIMRLANGFPVEVSA